MSGWPGTVQFNCLAQVRLGFLHLLLVEERDPEIEVCCRISWFQFQQRFIRFTGFVPLLQDYVLRAELAERNRKVRVSGDSIVKKSDCGLGIVLPRRCRTFLIKIECLLGYAGKSRI